MLPCFSNFLVASLPKKLNLLNSLYVRYHTVQTSSGPFVIALTCYSCPRAKIPYSCIPGYVRPVPPSMQLLHSVLLNQHYQSHLSRNPTWSYLTETNNFSVHDAITFYLLRNFCLPYLELFVHKNPDILTAQSVASTRRLSALPSTSATVVTSSSSTVTFPLLMSQPHHVPETPPEQAQATLLPSYESALHWPPDSISFILARLQSVDPLLISLI